MPGKTELELSAEGTGGSQFTLWPLAAISPNRMTT
jgi:hypothetical protein